LWKLRSVYSRDMLKHPSTTSETSNKLKGAYRDEVCQDQEFFFTSIKGLKKIGKISVMMKKVIIPTGLMKMLKRSQIWYIQIDNDL